MHFTASANDFIGDMAIFIGAGVGWLAGVWLLGKVIIRL
jgi:hypothetical protein